MYYKVKNIGNNNTSSDSTNVQWKIQTNKEGQLDIDLSRIQKEFDNKENCRNECEVADVFLVRNKKDVTAFINYAKNLKKTKNMDGYLDIVARLKKIQNDGQKYFSCTKCGGIGDAIIAIEMPSNMQMEHIDYSFNYLGASISKSNNQQLSVIKVLKII